MKIRNQLFIHFIILGITASLIISYILFIEGTKVLHQYNPMKTVTQIEQIQLIDSEKMEVQSTIFIPRNFLIAFNLLFILVSFISSYIMGSHLSNPMKELIECTNKIRAGNFKARVTNYQKNELGVLAESFNNMADMIENKINEMDKVGYILSHDLRAPLSTIIPLVNYIKEDNKENLTEESEKMLSMIESKAKQMDELIREILTNARREKKIKENIHVHSLVNSILHDLTPPPTIQIFIQHDLPVIRYHKTSLIQIYQNLIQNAIMFIDKKPGTIKIGYSEEGIGQKFWVEDNGPGILAKDFERIFEMFETTHSKSTKKSAGIGLGIVKNLIEENEGKIWVESELGHGSTFYFTISNTPS